MAYWQWQSNYIAHRPQHNSSEYENNFNYNYNHNYYNTGNEMYANNWQSNYAYNAQELIDNPNNFNYNHNYHQMIDFQRLDDYYYSRNNYDHYNQTCNYNGCNGSNCYFCSSEKMSPSIVDEARSDGVRCDLDDDDSGQQSVIINVTDDDYTIRPSEKLVNRKSMDEIIDGPQRNSRDFKSGRQNKWGNKSYADLITDAILSSPKKRLPLQQIYEWIVVNVPYFSDKADSSSSVGWKNSIRHNLSLHKKFVKIAGTGNDRCSLWTVDLNVDLEKKLDKRRKKSFLVEPRFRFTAPN